ncbi:hypothetical protein [Aquimarina sp. 2201CG14-23]|uniref:hypothetical protein n=1 Tax=Aquimarina mycalae TaxID=3040073 RepID=UPI002477DE64|nr:hypothetical protein [Aquimarina sp. 2201CG14-23]MDH7445716.1 hypothetical protein [Aquimarina sp. 2201CG14-23]
MKKLNLNILQKSILVFCLSIFAISCSKDDSIETQALEKDARETEISLSDDKDFIALTIEMQNYASFLEDVMNKNSLNVNELEKKLIQLQQEGLELDEQSKEIDKLFRYSVSVRTTAYTKAFSKRWNMIKERYGNIKQSNLESSFAKVLGTNTILSGGGSDGCNWRYYLCMGAAYAGTLICHAGCSLGIGGPACYTLCYIGVTYAWDLCDDLYCS